MTDTPEVTISKTRVKRTEHERALVRFNSKDAAVKKLEQRIEVKNAEVGELVRELQLAKKQRELHERMVNLAREVLSPDDVAEPDLTDPRIGAVSAERAAQ